MSQSANSKSAPKGRGKQSRGRARAPANIRRAGKQASRKNGAKGPRDGISLVSDGVNVGSVWKNTNDERVTFPVTREKYADLTSTGTTFQTLSQTFLNPGNTILFPVFSEIAKNYEQYIPNVLKVHYRTEEYMASGSTVSAGLCGIGMNFDPDAANFATMTELENYTHSISGPPFSGIITLDLLAEHKRKFKGRERDLSLMNYFVNYSPNLISPPSQTSKFYDIGNLQVCVNGTQAGVIGELWIEYSFTMIRRLQTPGAPDGGAAHWSAIAATTAANLSSVVLQSGNTLSGITMTASTITFPAGQPGNYMVCAAIAGSTSASAFGYSSVTGGVTTLALFSSGSVRNAAYQATALAGTTTNSAMCNISVSVTAAGGTLVFNASTIVGTGTVDVFIFSLPSTVLTLTATQQLALERDKYKALSERLDRFERSLSKNEVKDSEDGDDYHISTDLSASYISRVGEALGVVRKLNSAPTISK